MPAFTGTLNHNEIQAAMFNMIISQEQFADDVNGTYASIVDMARVDGTLAGDTKLYYATDITKTHEWGNDAEAGNLLELDRPEAPKVQAITIDIFRQIRMTIDGYLTKRAFSDEGTFSAYNAVILGRIRDTKRIYDATIYNSFIGTHKTDKGLQEQTIKTTTGKEALEIADGIANIIDQMVDVSRDYNDYGFMHSFENDSIKVIWNTKVINRIKKIDLPVLYHKDGLVDKFEEYKLPARYFGNINASGGTTTASNKTVRSLVEKQFGDKYCFPGDLLPNSTAYGANETYTEDGTIACKIVVKLPPYMSAMEVGTSFFNARSLTENHYLTFGHNTLQHLENYPFVTVKVAAGK